MTTVRIERLPHSDGLPLPAYETLGSAGMDLRAAVAENMPLMLAPSEWDTWLAAEPDDAARFLSQPTDVLEAKASELVVVPVSKWVNDAKHDDPKCLEPPSEKLA